MNVSLYFHSHINNTESALYHLFHSGSEAGSPAVSDAAVLGLFEEGHAYDRRGVCMETDAGLGNAAMSIIPLKPLI